MYDETARRFADAVRRAGASRVERAFRLECSVRQIEAYERGETPRLIETLHRLEQAGVITINAPAERPVEAAA